MRLETFFEKFDELVDLQGGVSRLRELICTLAIQGRLVSGDGNDESADELAARIAASRATFAKERRLARQRELVPVPDDDAPFPIPSHWRWTRLGALCRVQAGFAFESAAFVQGDSGVPVIRIRDITSERTQASYVGDFREEFLVDPGDYLIGMDGNFNVAKWRGPRALLNQRVSRLQWYTDQIQFPFFAIAAQRRLTELQGTKAYTTVDHLSTKQIEEVVVPLPPASEQKRIVGKVDELMALCDRLEAQQQERQTRHTALARASLARFADAPTPVNLHFVFREGLAVAPTDLRRTILGLAVQGLLVSQNAGDEPVQDLLARIDAARKALQSRGEVPRQRPLPEIEIEETSHGIPDSWAWARLQDVAEIIDPNPSHRMPHYEEGVPFISTENFVGVDEIDFSIGKQVPQSELEAQRSRFSIRPGSFALSRIGTIGKTRALPLERTYCMSHAIVVIAPYSEEIDPKYLRMVVSSDSVQGQAAAGAQSIGVPDLGMAKIRAFLVPMPPLAEQRRIVAEMARLMTLVDALESGLRESRDQVSMLLDAAVSELVAPA